MKENNTNNMTMNDSYVVIADEIEKIMASSDAVKYEYESVKGMVMAQVEHGVQVEFDCRPEQEEED